MNSIMRWAMGLMGVLALGAALVLTAGCETTGQKDVIQEATPVPFGAAPAKITIVNDEYRFVVVDFSDRSMPRLGSELSVYRGNRKIGRIRLTEPVRARFATADVLEGQLRVGDEAR